MRVLIIDAEWSMVAHLQKGLQEHGFVVDVVDDGAAAEQIALDREYSLAIASDARADAGCTVLLRSLRRRGFRAPIMVMSRCSHVEDRLESFAAGADDVLDRSTSFEELLARVDALLRRNRLDGSANGGSMHIADLELDRSSCRARRGSDVLALTLQEYILLSVLMERRGAVVSREFLTAQVWNLDFEGSTKVVDVAISRLRSKIDDPYDVKLLHTVRGVGYRLDLEDGPSA